MNTTLTTTNSAPKIIDSSNLYLHFNESDYPTVEWLKMPTTDKSSDSITISTAKTKDGKIVNNWYNNPIYGNVTVGNLEINGKLTLNGNQIVEKTPLEDNDVIFMQFDTNKWHLDEVIELVKGYQTALPNNPIIPIFDGMEIKIVKHPKEKEKEEVIW